MEAEAGKEFFDWETPASVSKNIEKDDDGQFKLKVIQKEKLTHDTYLFELEFPDKEWIAGIWPAGHWFLKGEIDGKIVSHPYTPVSPVNQKGSICFCFKVYREHADFPGGGKLT